MRPQEQNIGFEATRAAAAPLVLAVVELFHPHPDDLLDLDVHLWMLVHYAQIPLFALTALAVTMLLRSRSDVASTIARTALFVFALSFVAFDTVAGVAVGILVGSAQASANPQAWQSAIDALWTHPIMGGTGVDGPPSLAVLGRVSLGIGTIAAAASLKRGGSGWAPAGLLGVSSLGINLLHSHAWPGGPATFGAIALAVGWIRYQSLIRTTRADRTTAAALDRSGGPITPSAGTHVHGRPAAPTDSAADND
ncbi:hypothetical protein [Dyella sp.]|jgi:hypothetical protein|uniref:hypothetical protein n=1 Tax=Dyella sp. TaxID=1869338 RepID=UPI002D78B9CB|nr:hypothetical protein [Dyella sp.]HET6432251.1 hypothetical protein [Dyella sp.]